MNRFLVIPLDSTELLKVGSQLAHRHPGTESPCIAFHEPVDFLIHLCHFQPLVGLNITPAVIYFAFQLDFANGVAEVSDILDDVEFFVGYSALSLSSERSHLAQTKGLVLNVLVGPRQLRQVARNCHTS